MSSMDRIIRVCLLRSIVFGAFILLSLNAVGAIYNWDNDSGDGKWSTAVNWFSTELDNTPPQSDDITYIGVNTYGVYGTSVVDQAGAVSYDIMLGYNTGTKGELQVDGGELTVAHNLNIGYSGTGKLSVVSGTVQVTGNITLGLIATKPGGTLVQSGGNISSGTIDLGINDPGLVIQSGGTNTMLNLKLGNSGAGPGVYKLTGGELKPERLYLGNGPFSTGTVIQTGGLLNITNTDMSVATVADGSSVGRYQLDAGEVQARQIYVGANGTGIFTQTGGTNSMRDLILGNYGAGSYYLTGGVLEIGRNASSGYIATGFRSSGRLFIGNSNSTGVIRSFAGASTYLVVGYFVGGASNGLIRGWGTFDMGGAINNSGLIIADGYGTDRDLDFSPMSYVTQNSFANTTTNGWYAENHGKLILPSTLTANPAYWGERDNQDLVNSVKFDLSGTDSLDGALLATDHGAVPSGLFKPVGVWEFSNVSQTGTMTFLYDAVKVAEVGIEETRLYVWKYSGGAWQDITADGGLDTAANTITTVSLDPNGMFAIAPKKIGTVVTVK